MAVTPREETEAERREWWPVRFAVIILMVAAGVIALTWLGVWFPDRARHPGFWTATLVIVPIALLLIAGSVWMVRELSPTRTEAERAPEQPTKWFPFTQAAFSAICLAGGWTDLHASPGAREASWSPLLWLGCGVLGLFGMIRHARVFVRREDWPAGARVPQHQWLMMVGPWYIAAVTIRSLDSLMIALGLGTCFATGLMIYFYAHRTPAGEPFRRSDSEMGR